MIRFKKASDLIQNMETPRKWWDVWWKDGCRFYFLGKVNGEIPVAVRKAQVYWPPAIGHMELEAAGKPGAGYVERCRREHMVSGDGDLLVIKLRVKATIHPIR